MTKEGKCDTCRKRKLKCDEVHPICGTCKRGEHSCRYLAKKGNMIKFVDDTQPRHGTYETTWDVSRESDAILSSSDDSIAGIFSTREGLTFTLRSSRAAKFGSGVFQTFVPILSKENIGPRGPKNGPVQTSDRRFDVSNDNLLIRGVISSAATRLYQRWISFNDVVSAGCDTTYVMGDWFELIPQFIGRSSAVDAAFDCFLNSIAAFINRTSENFTKIYGSNATALKRVRADIDASSSGPIPDGVLLAITLLAFAELFNKASARGFRYHQSGLVSLVQRATKDGTEWNEVTRGIFNYCLKWDFSSAILEDRDSIWDKPSCIAVPSYKWISSNQIVSQMDIAAIQDYNKMRWIQIPRLVRLVKQARISVENRSAAVAAFELAAQLYTDDLEPWIQELLDKGVIRIVPTSSSQLRTLIQSSFDFSSYIAYTLCLSYWSLRIAVCGLTLALLNRFPRTPFANQFDMSIVAAADICAAEYIAMTAQQALESSGVIPLHSMLQPMPLMISVGAWHRLEIRSGGASSINATAQRARSMKCWCVSAVTSIGTQFFCENTPDAFLHRYEVITGILTTDDFPANMRI